MRRQHVYVDTSVIGGCEDEEFSEDSRALWEYFCKGSYVQLLSEHTLRELGGAPAKVSGRAEINSQFRGSKLALDLAAPIERIHRRSYSTSRNS